MSRSVPLIPIFVAAVCIGFWADQAVVAQPPQPEKGEPKAPQPAKKEKPKSNNRGSDKNGNPLRLAFKTGHISNYNEAKVMPYTLPDPLILTSGKPVKDADTWFKMRRPEILKLFETEIFGRVPAHAPKVKWQVVATEAQALNSTATLKRIVGQIGTHADGPRMNLSLYLPAKAHGSVPVILTITFGGGGKGPKAGKGNPMAKEILARGWAFASVGYGDIQPDRKDVFKQGVIGLTLKKDQTAPAADEWGAVSAWAWGISRIVDYFETDKDVDAQCVGIQGHSRLGRTVLWAGARDERIAAVFASCSGEAGAALARRDWGETVDDMAQNYPWQLAGNYQKWVGRWNDMPVDSHMLIALMAPADAILQRRHDRSVGRSQGRIPRHGRCWTCLSTPWPKGPGHNGIATVRQAPSAGSITRAAMWRRPPTGVLSSPWPSAVSKNAVRNLDEPYGDSIRRCFAMPWHKVEKWRRHVRPIRWAAVANRKMKV